MKKLLSDRFKELAGIKPLNEQGAPVHKRTKEYVEFYDLEELQDRLDQVYREMEQEAEPEGGPIADQYADEIHAIEDAIRIKKKSSQDKSYDEVYLKDKLVGIKDAYEYEVIKGKGRITIYPDLGSLQYKSRSTQEIVFTKDRGEIAFVRAFGYERSYDELKKLLPKLPEMGDSSFAGFMNVLPNPNIPVDIDTALEMIKAMVRGRDAESKAQSDFYGARRQPGEGGTGIDEISELRNMAKEMGFLKENDPREMGKHPDFQLLIKKVSEALNVKVDNTIRGGYYNGREGYYSRINYRDLYFWQDDQIETLKQTFENVNSETTEYMFEYEGVNDRDDEPGERIVEASFNYFAIPKN